jgi:deoxycytidylate deaminase
MLPRFLEIAIKIAESNEHYDKWKHGAIIVRGGRVLSVGQNKLKNEVHVFDENFPCVSVHAEVDAIKRCKDTRNAILYVARWSASGPANSEPCHHCRRTAEQHEIKRIVFTLDNELYGCYNVQRRR